MQWVAEHWQWEGEQEECKVKEGEDNLPTANSQQQDADLMDSGGDTEDEEPQGMEAAERDEQEDIMEEALSLGEGGGTTDSQEGARIRASAFDAKMMKTQATVHKLLLGAEWLSGAPLRDMERKLEKSPLPISVTEFRVIMGRAASLRIPARHIWDLAMILCNE